MIIKRNKSFASFVTAFLLLLILAFCVSSCSKESITLGGNFVDNNTTNVVLLDTSTIQLSTVYVDSFVTSGNGALFTGNYKDPQLGKISSESYMQIGIPSSTITIPNGAVYDSLEVILKPNKIFYGDTTVPYTISVHQLSSPLSFIEGQTAFYNINSWAYNSTSLATKQLYYYPGSTDTISIRLPQAMGQDLFDKLNNHADEVSTSALFYNYFRGLAFTGSAANNLVMGFSDSVVLRLHYLQPNVINQDVYIEFPMVDQTYNFSHISADRSGTPIAALGPKNNQIFSNQTGNAALSQYITGAVTKIQFPYLSNLLNLPNFVKIINAQLIVKPVANSYLSFFQLPPNLQLSTTDLNNQLGPVLTSGPTGPQYGNLIIDNLYGTGTQYTYDVTSYLLAQIAITQNNQNGLLILPTSPTKTLNRIVIGDSKNPVSQTKLIVYYASVQ